MNIVNKVTVRQLKENKRRTLVTIIGAIISVAMLTAVPTIAVSFMDMFKRQTIADEGEWHVLYKNVNPKQIQAIKNDEDTKKLILSRDLGYALLDGSKSESRPYLYVKQYNDLGFKQFPIELSTGRLPQTENEIVVSDDISKTAKVTYSLGDSIKLEIGKRISHLEDMTEPLDQSYSLEFNEKGEITEKLQDTSPKEFTIVGTIKTPIWEPAWAPGYTAISFLDESQLGSDDVVNASVVLKKVRGSLFEHGKQLAQKNNIEEVDFNYNLLRYYGVIKNEGMRTTLYSVSAIIMVIIIIGSISLIYNAFAISVSERSRHLGMLSSIGATRRQKRNSVFFEGAVIGIISIPLGIIFGLLGMGITFFFINSSIHGFLGISEKLKVAITPGSILVATIVSIITIFFSTFIPARRASRITAIDAIRQSMDIKLTGKAVKTSKIVRKLFGIEAEIGLKNLKRNKRRYQATVFSLVISIILFLSVAFFTDNLKKSLELSQDDVNFDLMVELAHEGDDQLYQSILSMDDVTKYSLSTEVSNLTTWVDPQMIARQVLNDENFSNEQLKDGKYPYYINLIALNDESLKNYAEEVGADYDELQNGSKSIVIDTIKYEDTVAGKYVETKAIHAKVGDPIDIYMKDWETEKETFIDQVTIAALTEKKPMGQINEALNVLNMIVSESTLNKLGKGALLEMANPPALYVNSKDPVKTGQKIEEIEEVKHYIYKVYQIRQQEQQMLLLMSVFSYGFIALITLISITNILNTISTSIALRKREFAMLKSMGMTPKGFNKMINYESIFYGIKALLYGLPLSLAAMFLIYYALKHSFDYYFTLPWLDILFAIIAVFLIVGVSMLYSTSKVKRENIIDALKQENI